MNIHFEAALQHINLEDYDKAKELLAKAIGEEMEKGDESTATQYRCVLGELCGRLDEIDAAREQFNLVIEYCDRTNSLPAQRGIAQTSLDLFDGKITPEELRSARKRSVTNRPLVGKPVQDKAFISRRMNKRK